MGKINDGWHEICGYSVYVEKGHIVRGVSGGKNPTTIYPYRTHWEWVDAVGGKRREARGWDMCAPISVDAFRAGVRRGTVEMF